MRYLSVLVKSILALVLLLFFLLITFNNMHKVEFHWFLSGQPIELPLIIFLFIFFLTGIFLGIIGMLLYGWKKRKQISKLKREEKRLVTELAKQNTKSNLEPENTDVTQPSSGSNQ